MRRSIVLGLSLPLLLASCTKQEIKPPADYGLTGSITGDWGTSPRLRLALVGVGLGLSNPLVNNSNIAQNTVSNGTGGWNFGFDLPGFSLSNMVGAYQVVVFDDANNDAALGINETFARNRMWLIYSPIGGTTGAITIPKNDYFGEIKVIPSMNLASGWNVYDQGQNLSIINPSSFSKFVSYNLSR